MTAHTKQTTRRFRVCKDCSELFYTERSARRHQHEKNHTTGIGRVTAVVQE